MNSPLVVALALGLGAGCQAAAAQDAPRQLGGAPVVPAPAPRQAAPAAQPLQTVPAPAPAIAADSARPTPVATMPAAPATAPPTISDPAPFNKPYVAGDAARPTRYQVGLRDGTVYNAYNVEVKQPLFGRNALLLDGQRRIDLDAIRFYENETGHYVRAALPGSSRETTLRREKTGRISLYATYTTSYASPGGFGMPGYGPGFGYGGYGGYGYGSPYRTSKTEYFSKDNGPIQNMSTRNLMEATAGNAGAQALLTKARSYQQSIIASYVVGGGLLAYGLLQSLGASSTGFSPVTYLAIPVLIVPIVLQGKQAAAQRQAITLYNGGGQ